MELQYFVCDVSRVNNRWIYWLWLWSLDGVINDYCLMMDNSFDAILRYLLEFNRMESKYRSYGTLQFGYGMLRHLPWYTALFVLSYVHPIIGSLCSIKIPFNLSCICITIFQDRDLITFFRVLLKKFFPHAIVLTDASYFVVDPCNYAWNNDHFWCFILSIALNAGLVLDLRSFSSYDGKPDSLIRLLC